MGAHELANDWPAGLIQQLVRSCLHARCKYGVCKEILRNFQPVTPVEDHGVLGGVAGDLDLDILPLRHRGQRFNKFAQARGARK